jgi:malonyl CoA-acyl carrier protein transacylase
MLPALLEGARSGKNRFFIQFGGQGNSFLKEMQILYERPELSEFFDVCFEAIEHCLNRPDVREELDRFYPRGFPLKQWLEKTVRPHDDDLYLCTITFAGNQITQLGSYVAAVMGGYTPDAFYPYVSSGTGHSGGLQAAVFSALGLEGRDLLDAAYRFVVWYTIAGFHSQRAYGFPAVPDDVLESILAVEREPPRPMSVVTGPTTEELQEYVDSFNASGPYEPFPVRISLINTDRINVITGHAADLARLRLRFLSLFEERKYSWNFVNVSIPFHRPDTMGPAIQGFFADEACRNFPYRGSDLKFPVYSFYDGRDLREMDRLGEFLADVMMSMPLYWNRSLRGLLDDPAITHVLDFGPGKVTTILTRTILEECGRSVELLSAVGRAGLRKILE